MATQVNSSFTTDDFSMLGADYFGLKLDGSNSDPTKWGEWTGLSKVLELPPARENVVNTLDDFMGYYPCVLKNGEEKILLDPNDYSKDIEGTSVDITSGNEGDVMIAFPMHSWYKNVDTENDITEFRLLKDIVANPTDNHIQTLTRGGSPVKTLYISPYVATVPTGESTLRSISGTNYRDSNRTGAYTAMAPLASLGNMPYADAENYATLKGIGYDIFSWVDYTYLMVCLYIKLRGNLVTNYYSNATAANEAQYTNGAYDQRGMNFGMATATYAHNKVFGIEDFYSVHQTHLCNAYYDPGAPTAFYYRHASTDSYKTVIVNSNHSTDHYITDLEPNPELGFFPLKTTKSGSSARYFGARHLETGTSGTPTYPRIGSNFYGPLGGYWIYDVYATIQNQPVYTANFRLVYRKI